MYDPSLSYYSNPQLRWRFGLKTLVDFPQDKYTSHSDSPGLSRRGEPWARSPTPSRSLNIIESLESGDLVGTAAYSAGIRPGAKAVGLSWLTDHLDLVRNQVATLQAGMWSTNTPTSPRASIAASRCCCKVPQPRRLRQDHDPADRWKRQPDPLQSQPVPSYDRRPAEDTLDAARDAPCPPAENSHLLRERGRGFRSGVDGQVAQIGQGEHFHAGGDVRTIASNSSRFSGIWAAGGSGRADGIMLFRLEFREPPGGSGQQALIAGCGNSLWRGDAGPRRAASCTPLRRAGCPPSDVPGHFTRILCQPPHRVIPGSNN